MKVICINENGWHPFNGNVYAFVEPREGLRGYPAYGQMCNVLSITLDIYGDILYKIEGYGNIGLDAEAFVLADLPNVEQEQERSVATEDAQ